MKTAIIKNNKLMFGLMILITLCCCTNVANGKKTDDNCENTYYYYIDIIGDSQLDTLFTQPNSINIENTDITLLKQGNPERIVTVEPRSRYYGNFVTTKPQIETIRLESNFTQSDDKELRIIVRNTDMMPDYLFIDLKYDNQWIVKRYYVCNSYTDEPIFISSINIEKPISEEFSDELIVNQLDIFQQFSTSK